MVRSILSKNKHQFKPQKVITNIGQHFDLPQYELKL